MRWDELQRPDEAIGFAKKAMRLDPNYGAWVVFFLGNSYFFLRRYDDAIVAYHDAIKRLPDYLPAHTQLTATYAELGRDREARAEAAEVIRLNPALCCTSDSDTA